MEAGACVCRVRADAGRAQVRKARTRNAAAVFGCVARAGSACARAYGCFFLFFKGGVVFVCMICNLSRSP